jgi:hypothetical protein
VAYQATESVELGNKGDGWRKKNGVIGAYLSQTGVTRGTGYAHYAKWAVKLYDNAKDGTTGYVRLKEEFKNVSKKA